MIRIALLLVLIIILFWPLLRGYLHIPPAKLARFSRIIGLSAIALLVVLLAVTGRLNWFFATLGVVLTVGLRLLPVLLRYAPDLHRLLLLFRYHRSTEKTQQQNSASSSTMTRAEAYEVLGLKPGATREEIIAAHKRLIQRMHPDRGGSDYLAARINLAKKTLLRS